jgi:hypothetical protein
MYKNLFLLLGFGVIFSACLFQKKAISNKKIKQGIAGNVFSLAGNQMPAPNAPIPKPQPLSTTIYIYELTNLKDVVRLNQSPFYSVIYTRFIDSTLSDKNGFFSIALPEGHYSLFTKINDQYYANGYDEKNNIQPVQVFKDSITHTTLQISYRAFY